MVDKKDSESRKALVDEIAWIFGFGGIGGALLWIWEVEEDALYDGPVSVLVSQD